VVRIVQIIVPHFYIPVAFWATLRVIGSKFCSSTAFGSEKT